MAAAVMSPTQGLALDGGIMAPSPVSQNSSRHGRSKHGGSVVKKGRKYSIVEDREALISKALSWVLKRTIKKGEVQEEGTEEKLVSDEEGWVDCEEVLQKSNISALSVTFPELQETVTSAKSRFALKIKPTSKDIEEEDLDETDYLLRMLISPATPATPSTTSSQKPTPLTTTTEDLPHLIVYETSYANYPLILASGGIKRAGGQAYLQFATIKVTDDGTEIRNPSDADVSIYIDLRSVMEADPSISWARLESGVVVTEGDAKGGLEKQFWKKAVGRRADIGVLFEEGVVKKEVPVGLRGKGVKGKRGGGKGKGIFKKETKAQSDDSEDASE